MTLQELKKRVMFQTNNDADDIGDFLPHVTDYINDGYDHAMLAWNGQHVSADGDYTPLTHDKSRPELPDWMHMAIADWATWLVYRNGSAPKQSRGYQFRASAEATFAAARALPAEAKGVTPSSGQYITNIPR